MSGSPLLVLPLALLAGGALVAYLLARLLRARSGVLALWTALVFVLALLALLAAGWGEGPSPTWGWTSTGGAFLSGDPGALVVGAVALSLGAVVALYSGRYVDHDQRYPVYYPLLLLLVAGLVGMVSAADLFNLYMFCELMSICAYALVAFRRHTDTAIEAGFKYLIIGSLGTALILLGISFVYRDGGQAALLWEATRAGAGVWTRVGAACILVGLGIKSALVPLHTWLPDAHGRAPSSVSAMLSGIVIQSAFYVLLKTSLGLGLPARALGTLLALLAVVNMTLGNAMALVQTNTKRLLAYSSIAQMGYVMLGVGLGLRHGAPGAIQAAFFWLLVHTVMKGLAFLSKGVCHYYGDVTEIEQLRGMAQRLPPVAVSLAVAVAGLSGIPPLAGFTGKWLILTRGLRHLDWLSGVVLALYLVNTLTALGYYLPLLGVLFARPRAQQLPINRGRVSAWMAVPLLSLGGMTLAMGFYPAPWLDWLSGVGSYLLGLGR
ncbi:MAG: NADH dehydrogenase [Anaerolineae bacterium]|nr:NADH dehydrogenase [Anaerolineae bacterium]